jgi:hypothetical protein
MPKENTFVNIEGLVTECFVGVVRFMRQGLKIALPYRWIVGIDGIKGKRMHRFAAEGRGYVIPYTGECVQDLITETGLLQEGDDPRLGLRPFFRSLYDACGDERGEHMDAALLRLES